MLTKTILPTLVLFGVSAKLFVTSPLIGKHLRVIPRYEQEGFHDIKRNASGFIQEAAGFLPEMLALLAKRNNFTYSYINDIARHTRDSASGRGVISYLLSGEADLALMGAALTFGLLKVLDFTVPITIIENSLLIPSPTVEVDVTSIAKPYRYEVWILILLAIPLISLSLHWTSRYNPFQISTPLAHVRNKHKSLEPAFDYVIAVFCSQGAYYRSLFRVTLRIRLLTGCWCLACFVLVTAYNNVFISYILTPRAMPIINSILDIPKKSHVMIITEQGATMEALFKDAKYGVYKHIGDTLRANPYLICNTTDECIDRVRSGKNLVYPQLITELFGIINNDLKENGDCRLTIAKNPISYPKLSLMVAKNSLFTEPINKEIQLFWESGLLRYWQNRYFPKRPSRCLDDKKMAHNIRLSMKHLVGAFFLLLMGYLISCTVFILRTTFHWIRKTGKQVK